MPKISHKIYKNKKVLVTGHTGFIGSWLSLWLVEIGAEVIGYSLEPPTKPSLFNVLGLKDKISSHVIGDVRDEKHLSSVMKRCQPEFVYHLAAQSLVRTSYKEPKLTYETNVMGTINVLETIRTVGGVKVCIIFTSDKCYENKEWVYGYRENDPMGGYDPYSSSKGCAELTISAYRQSFFNPKEFNKHGVAVASIRAGNVIGGGDWQKDRLFPDCIKALGKGKRIILRNPQAIRPWQYVLEPVSGYLWLGALMYQNGIAYSDAWNFGPAHGEIVSVEQATNLIIKHWGKGSYSVDTSEQPHEARLLKLDCSKIHAMLNWQSIYDIHLAIEKTVRWYKDYYHKKEDMYDTSLKDIGEYIKKAGKKGVPWSKM